MKNEKWEPADLRPPRMVGRRFPRKLINAALVNNHYGRFYLGGFCHCYAQGVRAPRIYPHPPTVSERFLYCLHPIYNLIDSSGRIFFALEI